MKLCVLIAGLFFAILLIVSNVKVRMEKDVLAVERANVYQSFSEALNTTYADLTRSTDGTNYKSAATKLLKTDTDLSYVVFVDNHEKVLFADTHRIGLANDVSFKDKSFRDINRAIDNAAHTGQDKYVPVSMPIIPAVGKQITIHAGFSTKHMNAPLQDMEGKFLLVFGIIFAIAILGMAGLSEVIAPPIKDLTEAIHSVMSGNLDVRLPSTTDDVAGELGSSFNQMVESLKTNNHQLILRANTDSLTGLFNHRYFQERLETELNRSHRYRRPLSLAIIDIDHFKILNDTHGHPFGDLVLQEVSQILSRNSREIDVVARYGGEEFVIILPETEMEEAISVAERIRVGVERYCFTENDGSCVPVSISVGIAQYPIHSTEGEGLIMAADLAMYRSKSAGRNRVTPFTNDLLKGAEEAEHTDPYKLHLLLHAEDISTIEAMAAAVDTKSRRRQGFSHAVMTHCVAIGSKMQLSDTDQQMLKVASLLYDIGKLGLSASVLTKTGALTEEERCIMKTHPALGYAIVQKSHSLRPILPSILHHHECWDGTGYPNCLKGGDIPLLARIISVVDSYHAMTSDRPYSKASTKEAAILELNRCAGSQFDPSIVDAFVGVLQEESTPPSFKAA